MRHRLLVTVVALFGLVLVACGDDDVDEAREGIEDAAGGVGARAIAEELRVALRAQELGADEHLRDVTTIRDAVDDLPGDPEVAGIEDGDGDGRDDDGEVEVRAGDQAACVTIAQDGDDVDVGDGACR